VRCGDGGLGRCGQWTNGGGSGEFRVWVAGWSGVDEIRGYSWKIVI
jgi:hypothetical protein